MEAVIFIGVQGAGKSSYFREQFFSTHVRVSLDLLKTRHREGRFLDLCLETGQRFVIDNTNPTRGERSRYIVPAREAGFADDRIIPRFHLEGVGAGRKVAGEVGKRRVGQG